MLAFVYRAVSVEDALYLAVPGTQILILRIVWAQQR